MFNASANHVGPATIVETVLRLSWYQNVLLACHHAKDCLCSLRMSDALSSTMTRSAASRCSAALKKPEQATLLHTKPCHQHCLQIVNCDKLGSADDVHNLSSGNRNNIPNMSFCSPLVHPAYAHLVEAELGSLMFGWKVQNITFIDLRAIFKTSMTGKQNPESSFYPTPGQPLY